jgi:hypothetical protein
VNRPLVESLRLSTLEFLHFPLDCSALTGKKHGHRWAQSCSFAVIPTAAEGSRAVRRDFFCLLHGEVGPFRVDALDQGHLVVRQPSLELLLWTDRGRDFVGVLAID